jgi:hypothetical protein
MIYTDGIHLISDESLEELHAFAARLGLKKAWLHHTPGRPHYDLTTEAIRAKATAAGALRVGRREFVAALRRNPDYQKWLEQKKRRTGIRPDTGTDPLG